MTTFEDMIISVPWEGASLFSWKKNIPAFTPGIVFMLFTGLSLQLQERQ
jgi:hypothetical protein